MSWNEKIGGMSSSARIGMAAVLVAVGAAGGAGAVSMTRPAIVMAPSVPTAIAKLSATSGIVAVKGRVAEVFGNRLVLQDASGRTMIDAGRGDGMTVAVGDTVTAQGRYDDGQFRASFLIDQSGQVHAVGPRGPRPHDEGPGRERHGKPHTDGPIGMDDEGPAQTCAPVDTAKQLPPTPSNAGSPK